MRRISKHRRGKPRRFLACRDETAFTTARLVGLRRFYVSRATREGFKTGETLKGTVKVFE